MEEYHQGVFMGFDTSKVSEPAENVYNVWTDPTVDYQVFLDTQPPRVIIDQAGAWQLGNRFIAAAREAFYWMKQLKENFMFHRAHSFILVNGLGPLFNIYAKSLDYLVEAAWESVIGLRKEVLIFLVVEALVIHLVCTIVECSLVYRLEAARLLGVLAIVGLPGPVLRQLAAADTKIVNDSDDESVDDESLAGSDDNTRAVKGAAGDGGSCVKESLQPAAANVTIASVAAAPPTRAVGTVSAEVGDTPAGAGCVNDREPGVAPLMVAGEAQRSNSAGQQEAGLKGRTMRAMRFQMSRKSRAPGDPFARSGNSSQRLQINGKTLVPSRTNLAKFMVPFLIWSLAALVVYIVTVIELNGMQTPLTSLNLASRIIYRYTRIRAIGAVFVSRDDAASKAVWRPVLSKELDVFESEYNALMYGGIPSSMENSTFRRYVEAATFASSSFAKVFFRQKICFRYDQRTCFQPGDEYYEITHNGLDAMVRRMVYEMRLLSLDDDKDVVYNSSRYAFTSIVGANDLYEGLQQTAQLFVDYSINHFNQVISMHTILLVISIGLVLAYFFFLLWPHLARTVRDATRQSALLSLVPPETDVRAHVRTVFKRALGRKKAGIKQQQQQQQQADAPKPPSRG
ncbi:hypothetical protein PLESTB_001450400 [Pleodorina starrii]|uniref:Uncharacterized protein n=1 Tax=Pleodorina starrii TaxID=330485 RepID=A0A9W6BWG1_9CHLO|nr:hypothetical protein PLESTB_001450400 [Pleodorina starrii]